MNSSAFFDTNVFVYADDKDSPLKQDRARQLLKEHRRTDSITLSLQVMQEYYATTTKKLGVNPEIAQRKVEMMAKNRVVRFTASDLIGAIELHRLNRLSFWDAMIVHAARLAGVETLFTEDMQHGATIAGVRMVNPFVQD